jgi:hypothetical protein
MTSGLDLKPGAEIGMTLNSVAIFGAVRHSKKIGPDSFTAGVRITKVLPATDPATAVPLESAYQVT